MKYIILDLEWDSTYAVKYKRFVNQIIQIGAVKLDESFNIVDTFDVTIRSPIAKKVSGRFSKITGITTEMMLAGMPFEEAVNRYNQWAGTDTVTMSWSTSDLFSIFDNEKLMLENTRFNLEKYLDLQKFVQNELKLSGYEITSQISLSNAAELLNVSLDGIELHNAKNDSLVCVALLKKTYTKKRFDDLIRDTRNPEFQRRLFFKPYYINDISDPLIDREELKFLCENCGKKLRRSTKWRYRNRWFCAEFKCNDCNTRFSCRICFRKNYDNIVVKKRCVPVVEKTADTEVNHEMQALSTSVQ